MLRLLGRHRLLRGLRLNTTATARYTFTRTLASASEKLDSKINFVNQVEYLREKRSSLASDPRFERFINDFKSPDAFANALADKSWNPLYEFPTVLEPPKNTDFGDTIHVQITKSRADAVMHVLRAHEERTQGAALSGAQGASSATCSRHTASCAAGPPSTL